MLMDKALNMGGNQSLKEFRGFDDGDCDTRPFNSVRSMTAIVAASIAVARTTFEPDRMQGDFLGYYGIFWTASCFPSPEGMSRMPSLVAGWPSRASAAEESRWHPNAEWIAHQTSRNLRL